MCFLQNWVLIFSKCLSPKKQISSDRQLPKIEDIDWSIVAIGWIPVPTPYGGGWTNTSKLHAHLSPREKDLRNRMMQLAQERVELIESKQVTLEILNEAFYIEIPKDITTKEEGIYLQFIFFLTGHIDKEQLLEAILTYDQSN